ncbi:DUF262 domain-containing protein [Actinocrinis puniceicyclus]|uniref:DUF262 domain-containing protein n=1 Tax=Actinocrinis puniceicyclus TaxID=977794 RepID=A0A8J7WKP3_9ACTN|nr:DUF262 domain-containing protein [Actinocrinis puniceicyclus]MBS2964096.1 DUF262 domain-containing protein [Actinocrinis puniceicyclus]
MRAGETTLAGLLEGKKQFQVPLFQRPYSWKEQQLTQLWSDILEQADLIAEGSAGSAHFLGSVVHAPSPQHSMGFPHALVVDGQQRLTTLSLALAAIRDHVAKADAAWAHDISNRFLVNSRTQGSNLLRLVPTQVDRAVYSAHINGIAALDDDSRVGAAYRFFRAALAATEDPADTHSIQHIEEAITSRLTLVEIAAGTGDNVYRIFQSLNNTGLELSQTDLVRNYVFMHLPTRGEHVYETLWTPLQKSVNDPKLLEDLIWLELILSGANRVRRQDVYRERQVRFEQQPDTEDTYEDWVRELRRRSVHYLTLIDPNRESDAAVRGALWRLRAWDADTPAPAIMLLLDRRERGEATSEQVAKALTYIESFLVRRMICRVPPNGLNRIFQDLPGQLPADMLVDEGVRKVLSGERRSWPDDAELLDAIRTKPFYLYGRGHQRQFVLRRLEESYDHPEPVDFVTAKLTVEHVLPQGASKEWLAVLAEDAIDGETPAETHRRLVHTLGNLTLTAQNSELSNHPFQRKQDLFKASHLEMNRRIAEAPRWGATEIEQRAKVLAQTASILWPSPVAGVGRVERGRDWSLLHQALAILPPGAWTSYGDLAALIGSAAQPVGAHLAQTTGVANAHRVLTSDGRVSPGFRWMGEDRGNVLDILRDEGVRFNGNDAAEPKQRLSAPALAALLDLGDESISEKMS